MDYFLTDSGGRPFNARIEIQNGRVFLHSRSGRSGGRPPRNPHYRLAFDAILQRLNADEHHIDRVLIDSIPARLRAESDRVLATVEDFRKIPAKEVGNLITKLMRSFGRDATLPKGEGNSNKRLRFDTALGDAELKRLLRAIPAPPLTPASVSTSSAPVKRLPAEELRKVQTNHIVNAVERLLAGEDAPNFDLSKDYDALTPSGDRLAPKKVFGLALEKALGLEAKPAHFRAGWGTVCFEALEKAGLWIVPKGPGGRPRKPTPAAVKRALGDMVVTDEERTWIEGNPRIVRHLRKERSPGLAKKKKRAFITKHGKLFCERCELVPETQYSEEVAEACIEVHHHRIHVADMEGSHETKLEDLRCLCANCHRVLHREITLGVAVPVG
jgi:hypothetical protein